VSGRTRNVNGRTYVILGGWIWSNIERLFAEAEAAEQRGDGRTVMMLMEQLWLVGPGRKATQVDPVYLERARQLLTQAFRPLNGAKSKATQVDPVYLERARQLLTQAFRPLNGAKSQDGEWSAVDRLGQLTIPVLLIAGGQDVPDIVGAARFMADRLPLVRFEMIEDAAHLPNMERPDQFDGILGDWLVTIGAAKLSGSEA